MRRSYYKTLGGEEIMTYTAPCLLTQQFRFCGNPLRIDLYKGCDFQCSYCFANNRKFAKYGGNWDKTTIQILDRLFAKAFDKKPTKRMEPEEELMRARVPMHCGGMSDPFQKREWDEKLTYHLIELSIKYQYPIIFSTKAGSLPDEYWDLLDPKLHAFQQSIMGYSDEFIRKFEPNTPTASERLKFTKKLHDKGFWTCIRIQPFIDLKEAKELLKHCEGIVDYIIIEHLKISKTNEEAAKQFKDYYDKEKFYCPPHGAHLLVKPAIKKQNFKEIAEIANNYGIKVGCGDNDAHELSQSRCCCGIDTIPSPAFNNWLKYNLTYFLTGEVTKKEADSLYVPQCEMYMPFADKEEYHLTKDKNFKYHVDEYVQKQTKLLKLAKRTDILQTLYKQSVSKRLF